MEKWYNKSSFVRKKGNIMKKDKKMVQDALLMLFDFGINMIVPIFLCTLFGVWLGEKLGINWLAVPFFFIGALSGYTNIFKRAKRFIEESDTKKEKDVKKN